MNLLVLQSLKKLNIRRAIGIRNAAFLSITLCWGLARGPQLLVCLVSMLVLGSSELTVGVLEVVSEDTSKHHELSEKAEFQEPIT
ncbi:hypothetical protein GYH30_031672 [Glycine max]|uniref:Uncharacterized protein n=1 Tax=Glycine soja TaxID=3848 RepID=A0A445I4K9_GLYSO|nr:hypothetical protein JHK87_031775 [Glycine soja]KAH1160012.1 hypothetical protein GYH30_031672 [Glycine max]RZB81043.1 hypothetical protein D0Y65_030688 [Glycine soja]